MIRKLFPFICLITYFFSSAQTKTTQPKKIDTYHYTTTKKLISKHGVVVSAHPLASIAGKLMLEQGGNAIDAVIATQFALAVVYPDAGNLGGGGFMVAHLSNGKSLALDYRETAPEHAGRDMYLNAKGDVIPGKSINGHLSSGVPGSVAGLIASLKYAKLPLRVLIQPAIDLAEKGFILSDADAKMFNEIQSDLRKYNTVQNVFERTVPWKKGDTLVQKDLAETLKRIKDYGFKGFYEGKTANLIVAEMNRGGGIVTTEDLKNYKAKWRAAHVFSYKGYMIEGMPMPSSGGILLHQIMKMVEPFPLEKYGFESLESVQVMTEAERRAYADRAEYMGDADYYKVPEKQLVDETYLKNRMKDFVMGKAGNSERIKPGILPAKQSEQTTHISAIDNKGNAASVTTTLNNSFGSKTVVGGAGFFLNDEMDDFSAKPGTPNLYGAVGGEANAIVPGKRMLSSMTPTIVLKKGKIFLVVGTPGGTTIPTTVFQTIVNIIDFKLSTEDAVYKPRFHHQWLPDQLYIEKGFPSQVKDNLQKIGYKIVERNAIGRTEAIRVLQDGSFEAIADFRGNDGAAGY